MELKNKLALVLVSIFILPSLAVEKAPMEKLRVAVVDSGLDIQDPRFSRYICPGESRDFTGRGINDEHGHGTHVASVIIKNANNNKFCLIILKYFSPENSDHDNSVYADRAMEYIKKIKPSIVNYSGGGDSRSEFDEDTISSLPKTMFIFAAGNDSHSYNYRKYYPAALTKLYDNVIVVGNGVDQAHRALSSNYDYPNMEWVPGIDIEGYAPNHGTAVMTGTSQSTAIYTGRLLNLYKDGQW